MMDWKQLLYVPLSHDFVLGSLREQAASTGVTVLAYHELAQDNADVEAWTVVRKSDFLRQMDYLSRHYDIVTLDRAIARLEAPTGASRPLAVITFDDGDRGNADVLLPIVEELRIPVTVYIATRQVVDRNPYWFDQVINALQVDTVVDVDLGKYGLGRYQINRARGSKNWLEIERLLEALKALDPAARAQAVEAMLAAVPPMEQRRKNGQIEPMRVADVKALATCSWMTIGSHSHCHNLLTQLSASAAEESVKNSKSLLEQWTGRTIEHFAYPNGTYDNMTVGVVRKTGFRSAVTFESRLWRRVDSLYCIPRVGIGRYDSFEKFKLNLVGGLRGIWRSAA